jgi:hypothetical protein
MKNYLKILSIYPSGYGQKTITVLFYGKELRGHYTEMPTYDLFNSREKGWKTAGNRIYKYIVTNNKPNR